MATKEAQMTQKGFVVGAQFIAPEFLIDRAR
jgi:hypothetical protein